jgi:hypothetical protein
MSRPSLVLAFASALTFAAACGHKPPTGGGGGTPEPIGNTGDGAAVGPHEVMATLERTACYGTCPMYSLTVYRDGTVEYNGEQFVKTQLDDLFTSAHYFDLKDAYTDYDVTDNPSAKTSYSSGGKTKTIDHYYGDSDAPEVLSTIEDGIDKIVHIEQFIGTEQERDQNSYYRH